MTKARTATITGAATPEQIEQWKKQHGDIFAYEADDMICYLKRPDRNAISAATVIGTNSAGQTDPFKFADVIIANIWLGGHDPLRTQDKYFMGLSQKINQIVEIKVGELKKL